MALQPNSIFLQTTAADAAAAKTTMNEDFVAGGVDGIFTAVDGQVNNHFVAVIPTGRVVEYNASDDEKKNNFALFTAIAQGPDYAGVDFTEAWTAEYNKIY